ncbi:MAG: TetR/AcrR family transcriptional regulator [Desulfitobacterium sp.]|nr:TetR/AcrR family transcriptional regulator [Desulfitobacterium sp.]
MPTQTFFNLPEEKRRRIMEAAIKEFSEYPFEQANITRIIEEAKIPRGSFYQYFENLKDLYKYTMDVAVDLKIKYFGEKVLGFQGEGFDFFTTLRHLFLVSLDFAREYPELLALGNLLIKEKTELQAEVMKDQNLKTENVYGEMLQKGVALGQLNPQVDPTAALLFMQALNHAFTDYYIAMTKNGTVPLDEVHFMKFIDNILEILANGLGNSGGGVS